MIRTISMQPTATFLHSYVTFGKRLRSYLLAFTIKLFLDNLISCIGGQSAVINREFLYSPTNSRHGQ